jgi:hypothetical protein
MAAPQLLGSTVGQMSNQSQFIEALLGTSFSDAYLAVARAAAAITQATLESAGEAIPMGGVGVGVAVVERLRDLRAAYELDPTVIDALAAPLYERVTNYEPEISTIEDRALTALVVRNCPIVEGLHTVVTHHDNTMGKEFVERITTELCPLVAAAWLEAVPAGAEPAKFLGLRDRYPDAWELFRALAESRRLGTTSSTLHLTDREPTPFFVRLDDAFDADSGRSKADGVDPRVHHDELVLIGWLAQNREVPYRTTDWTRLGRSCDKLLSLVDGLLTRHISVITINAHIEGDQMRLRQPPLPIPGDFAERLEALHDTLRARDLSTNPSNCEPIRDVFCDLQRDTRMGDGATRNFLCVCGSGRKRKKCCTVLPRTPPSVV